VKHKEVKTVVLAGENGQENVVDAGVQRTINVLNLFFFLHVENKHRKKNNKAQIFVDLRHGI